MPFDSQGNFSRLHNWEDDRLNNIEIVSDRHDEEDDNFAEGLSQCMLRDGRGTMNGDLDMGNFQVKNIADASLDDDAVNLGQVRGMLENINGVAHLSGAETFTGNKTFTGTVGCSGAVSLSGTTTATTLTVTGTLNIPGGKIWIA